MIANVIEWTVVIVGQWNPRMFSPMWIGRHLGAENLETAVSVGPAVASEVRYQTQRLILLPSQERFIVGVRNVEDDTLTEMERTARTVLQLLTHTPVQALGINFGFTERDVPREMLQTFELSDSGSLSDAGYRVPTIEITRDIEIAPATLKLKMTLDGAIVRLHFNFSHQISSADEAASFLEGKVREYRDRAMDIMTNVFHLQSEEVTQSGH